MNPLIHNPPVSHYFHHFKGKK